MQSFHCTSTVIWLWFLAVYYTWDLRLSKPLLTNSLISWSQTNIWTLQSSKIHFFSSSVFFTLPKNPTLYEIWSTQSLLYLIYSYPEFKQKFYLYLEPSRALRFTFFLLLSLRKIPNTLEIWSCQSLLYPICSYPEIKLTFYHTLNPQEL